MFIRRILIPQPCLGQMPVVKKLFCNIFSLAGICCRKVHDYANLIQNKNNFYILVIVGDTFQKEATSSTSLGNKLSPQIDSNRALKFDTHNTVIKKEVISN